MTKLVRAFALSMTLLFFPALSYGQQFTNPVVTITGNEQALDIGQMIKLQVNIKPDTVPGNLVHSQFFWDSDDVPIEEIQPDGLGLRAGTGKAKKTISFTMFGFFEYRNPADAKGGTVIQRTKQKVSVTVDDVAPPQPPTPPPSPAPVVPAKPSFPASTFGLNQFFAESLLADTKMTPSEKQLVAKTVKDSLSAVYSKIMSDVNYRNFNTVYGDMVKGLTPLSSVSNSSAFSVIFQQKMYDLYKSKAVDTVEEFSEAAKEGIEGFTWVLDNVK